MILQNSTAVNYPVLLVDSSDHITGVESATLTITASKNGAAFASISPTVTELSDGWYSLALTSSHTDTNGALLLHIEATGADPIDLIAQVVAYNPNDAALGISDIATILADTADMQPRLVDVETDVAALQSDITTIRKRLINKRITDPDSGEQTIYDDDDTTPLLTGDVWEDVDGTQPYRGQGADRQDRLT